MKWIKAIMAEWRIFHRWLGTYRLYRSIAKD